MDTVNSLETNNIAFINDKSPVIDAVAKDLATSVLPETKYVQF